MSEIEWTVRQRARSLLKPGEEDHFDVYLGDEWHASFSSNAAAWAWADRHDAQATADFDRARRIQAAFSERQS